MKTVAMIVAAGRGLRAGNGQSEDLPKQYRDICGEPLLRLTLRAFAEHSQIDAILPVIHQDDAILFQSASIGVGKLLPPVFGGATRQDSVHAGLESLIGDGPETILIHDGARPFVSAKIISDVIETVNAYGAALPATAVTDTLRRGENGIAGGTVERYGLYASQTPQGFAFKPILEAHRRAGRFAEEVFTDDAAIAKWAGMAVPLVEGSADNIKITHPEDFELAELKTRSMRMAEIGLIRTGQGFDVHAFGQGDEVVICGVKIPHSSSLKGHSDADVGLHALTDALLGAICAGDIGTHFPPSDPKWQDADSEMFLSHAASLVTAAGGKINHVDVTIICEAPKIGPHRAAMTARIAEILRLDLNQVNVKATTTEQLGFTGRREGIAAQAVATVTG